MFDVVDLCCGTGGWTDAFLRRGLSVVGFDIRRDFRYHGELVLQDVWSLTGQQFLGVRLIVASPPCQEFSHARAPALKHNCRPDLSIVESCFRLAREAQVPLVLENVHGAQRWLGPARHHWGKFYLWGDGVPALLPDGPRWKERWKSRHRSPMLKARIPDELAEAVAAFHFPT